MKFPAALLLFALGVAHAATPLPDQSHDMTLGVVNCASSLCHGSVLPWKGSPVEQNEYVIWSRLDKHARAYNVLLNEKSRNIAAKLGLPQPAHLTKECLDCHAHNPAPALRDARFKVSDSVGCEACHGPSQRWLPAHTEPDASHASNMALGLYPLDQPLARATLCLSCHIGNTTRYVNHRTMAAGHPRLNFELNTFTSLQPAHFRIDDDYKQRKGVSGGATVWAIGQAIAVRTQMEVLQDAQRGRDGAFPELTLFDCHACHHAMGEARWKPRTAFGGGITPGLVRLNDSSMLMLRLVLRELDPPRYNRFAQATAALHQAIAGQGNFTQAALAVQQQAQEAAMFLAGAPLTLNHLQRMATQLIDDGKTGQYPDYAAAEQAAMALGSLASAMQQASPRANLAALNQGLAALRRSLEKDEAYVPAEFAMQLQALRTPLTRTQESQ